MIREISPALALEQHAAGSLLIVDVREQTEWDERHLNDVLLLPLSAWNLSTLDGFPDKDQSIAFLCKSGKRSLSAAEFFAENEYTNIATVIGGMEAIPET